MNYHQDNSTDVFCPVSCSLRAHNRCAAASSSQTWANKVCVRTLHATTNLLPWTKSCPHWWFCLAIVCSVSNIHNKVFEYPTTQIDVHRQEQARCRAVFVQVGHSFLLEIFICKIYVLERLEAQGLLQEKSILLRDWTAPLASIALIHYCFIQSKRQERCTMPHSMANVQGHNPILK